MMFESTFRPLKGLASFRISGRSTILIAAFIMVVSELILIPSIWNNSHFVFVEILRYIHLFISLAILVGASLYKKSWPDWMSPLFYVLMVIPVFVIGWFNQVAMATSQEMWKPYVGFQPVFFGLAVLFSGSFLLNFLLIVIFAIESLVLWFHLESYHTSNLLASGEPYSIMLFAFVSLCLLVFRYQDERTYRNLMLQKARSELVENLAKIFLSIRDRANSPLQSLYLLAEILKRKKTVDQDVIYILENSITRLNTLNKKLIRYESYVPWEKQKHLMSDEEIDTWMLELEHELERIKNEQNLR